MPEETSQVLTDMKLYQVRPAYFDPKIRRIFAMNSELTN